MKQIKNLFYLSIVLELGAIGFTAFNYSNKGDLVTIVCAGILLACSVGGIGIVERHEKLRDKVTSNQK